MGETFISLKLGHSVVNSMANPLIHSQSSVKRWGGEVEDYMKIHSKMDCSKAYFPDNRHRALTHTFFWVYEVMIPLFGDYIVNKDGKSVSVKDICELHILEDYRMKFVPTAQDWLQEIDMKNWMQNGFKEVPDSYKKIFPNGVTDELAMEKKVTKILVD